MRYKYDTIRYDALPSTVCATWCGDGALTLPAARVKHQEQAAATAMTVSDEARWCGSTLPRGLLAGPGMTRVVGNGWLRCCDDRCRPSTATSKRHPNPADQCKSIPNPRLESCCCHASHAFFLPPRCCRALAALPSTFLCSVFTFSPGPSTQRLPIREYGEHMERSIAGRRPQGGSCRLAEHIHTPQPGFVLLLVNNCGTDRVF